MQSSDSMGLKRKGSPIYTYEGEFSRNTCKDENIEYNIKAAFRIQLIKDKERRLNNLIAVMIACFTCPDILAQVIVNTNRFANRYSIVKTAVLSDFDVANSGDTNIGKEVRSAILSTGDIDLVYSLIRSVVNGNLSKLDKIFFTLTSQGQLDETILKDWHFIEAPNERFLRYRSELTVRRSGFLFRKDKFDSKGNPISADEFLLPLSFILDPIDRATKIAAINANVRNNAWNSFFGLMYSFDKVKPNYNINERTVLEVLRFWGVGSNDFILDEGFDTGITTPLASVVLNSKAIEIDVADDMFSRVLDLFCSINA